MPYHGLKDDVQSVGDRTLKIIVFLMDLQALRELP